jgi:hypothetical protein
MRAASHALCLALSLAFSLALGGCTQFPELNGTVAPELEAAAYPALVPLEPLLNSDTLPVTDTVQTTQDLQARIAALRARARALQRRAVVDGSARQRLSDGLG